MNTFSNFINRNTVLQDNSWDVFRKKNLFNKITSMVKWNADAILTEEQVKNNFSFISEKNNIIDKNISKIISEIIKNWGLSSYILKELFLTYVEKKYISITNIENALFEYFKSKTKEIYNITNSPLKWFYYWWETKIIKAYHDVDHDLLDEEKEILAYWMKNWFLYETEFNRILEILKMWWDDLDYFYKCNYKNNLIEIYLNEILNK